MTTAQGTARIAVYLDDGRVYSYDIVSDSDGHAAAKAREHAAAIVAGGYRHCEDGELEHYPPHRILKVKATSAGLSTKYPDTASGT